jgi:hypothetical protein
VAIGWCAASVPDDLGGKRVVVQGWAAGHTGKVVPGGKVRPGSTWQTGLGAADAGNSGCNGDGLGVRQSKVQAEVADRDHRWRVWSALADPGRSNPYPRRRR